MPLPAYLIPVAAGLTTLAATSVAVLYLQATYIKRTTQILPPASGPTTGTILRHPPSPSTLPPLHLRLLFLGDSVIAGIGVAHTSLSLPCQLSTVLADALSTTRAVHLEWAMLGRSGATALDLLRLLPHIPPSFLSPSPSPTPLEATNRLTHHLPPSPSSTPLTLCILSVGVNHIARLDSPSTYTRAVTSLITALRATLPPPSSPPTPVPVFICGMPPMAVFPTLPFPLSLVLGLLSTRLDRALTQLTHTLADVHHLAALDLFTATALTPEGVAAFPPTVAAALRGIYEKKGDTGGVGGVGFPLDAARLFKDQLAADGYHPGEAGCRVMAAIAALPIAEWVKAHAG